MLNARLLLTFLSTIRIRFCKASRAAIDVTTSRRLSYAKNDIAAGQPRAPARDSTWGRERRAGF